MLEQHRAKDVLILVMTITMVVTTAFIIKPLWRSAVDTLQPTETFTSTAEIVTPIVASTSIRSFKSREELETFLESDDSTAKVLRTYMLTSTSTASTSLLK